VQPAQLDAVDDPTLLLTAPLSPPLLKPKRDIFLFTSEEPHSGQFTASSCRKTRTSKSFPHFPQRYSKIGIINPPFDYGAHNPIVRLLLSKLPYFVFQKQLIY
jgi:hypothetical protein